MSTENPVTIYTFKKDADVIAYIDYLIQRGLAYHFDDDLLDIMWNDTTITANDIQTLNDNNNALWLFCNPWEIMELYPELWERFKNAN